MELRNDVKENYCSWDYSVYTIPQVTDNEDCDKFLSYLSYKDNNVPVIYDSCVPVIYDSCVYENYTDNAQAIFKPALCPVWQSISCIFELSTFGHNLKDDKNALFISRKFAHAIVHFSLIYPTICVEKTKNSVFYRILYHSFSSCRIMKPKLKTLKIHITIWAPGD